ncbi:hypothetical protein BH18ACT6_BH18ACT6_06750 [soil metagenome]
MRRFVPVVLFALFIACGGGQSVFSLPVGTCFDDQSGDEISSVPEVECSEPHDNEVFALIDYTETDVYPGPEEISDIGTNVCVEQFEAYVGIDYLSSALEVFSIYPSEDSWADGDRELICVLYNVDLSKLTGSMEGAAR